MHFVCRYVKYVEKVPFCKFVHMRAMYRCITAGLLYKSYYTSAYNDSISKVSLPCSKVPAVKKKV